MANIKFSQFTVETAKADVDFLVGYSGPDNVQISPTNLLADYPAGSGAAGQVTFFSAASTVTGDNDFYWDNTNKRLGIGTTSPDYNLHVKKASTNTAITIEGSTNAGANFSSKLNFSNKGISGNDIDFTIGLKKTNNFVFMGDAAANELMRIEGNTGDVGIGTATPSAKLHVDGTLIATGISQLGSGGNNVYLTSSSAGNVGIGDNSPTAKLVVNNVGTKMLELKRGGNIKLRVLADSNDGQLNMFNSGTSNKVRLHTNGDSYFTGGNVGIGTVAPAEKLEVNGNILVNKGTTNRTAYVSDDGLYISRTTVANSYTSSITADSSSSGNNLNIKARSRIDLILNGNTTLVADDVGRVGVNNNSPGFALDVVTSDYRAAEFSRPAGTNCYIVLKDQNTTNDVGIGATTNNLKFRSGNSDNMILTSAGNLGIGNTSPAYKLDVSGSLRATGESTFTNNLLFPDNSRIKLGTGEDLQIYHDGSNSYIQDASGTGDIRIASNIVHLNNAASTEVMLKAIENGAVELYYNDNKKLETTTDGATILGGTGVNTLSRLRVGGEGAGNNKSILELVEHIQGTDMHYGFSFTCDGDGSNNLLLRRHQNSVTGSTVMTVNRGDDNVTFEGDVEIANSSNGIILESPDGTRYRVTVANGGTLSVSAV